MSVNTQTSDVFHKSLKPRAVEEFLDYYFYRRMAFNLIPLLVRFKLSPNQVTTLSLAFGLTAASVLYRGLYVSAVVLALTAIILDCCDGQLARLTGQTSPYGRVLDGLFDLVWVASFWVALRFGQGGLELIGLNHTWIFPLMYLAAASTILHCWRFDAAKVTILEMTGSAFNDSDLDVNEGYARLKQNLKHFRIHYALLDVVLIFQMLLFVRGFAHKKQYTWSSAQKDFLNQGFDPVLAKWSWLGEGHHNSLILLGVLLLPISVWPLVGILVFTATFMNVYYLFCEILLWQKTKKLMQGVLGSL